MKNNAARDRLSAPHSLCLTFRATLESVGRLAVPCLQCDGTRQRRPPVLSQDGNSLIDSSVEQNIRLHTRPGLDQSPAAGAGGSKFYPAGRRGRECPAAFHAGPCSEAGLKPCGKNASVR
jgi:hypothetical protein